MAVTVDPEFVGAANGHGGALYFLVVGATDLEAARRGLELGRERVFEIPDPEEPEEPFPSYCSNVEVVDGIVQMWLDAADIEAYDGMTERVLEAVVSALDESGANGTLTTRKPT